MTTPLTFKQKLEELIMAHHVGEDLADDIISLVRETLPMPCVPKVKGGDEAWHIAGWNDYYMTAQKRLSE